MYSHVMLGTNDLEASKRFYDALLGVIGADPGALYGDRVFWFTPQGGFAITKPLNGEPATAANGGTIGFAASSTEQVDAFHAAALAHGGTTCEDPPGKRESGMGDLYLAYFRDPDGNKLCAMHRMA